MGIMLDLLFLFAAGLLSFFLYPIWINFVYKFQMGEEVREDAPKTHLLKMGTPTMGGLVLVSAVQPFPYTNTVADIRGSNSRVTRTF